MATFPPSWLWSAEYQNYYYVTYGQGNLPNYHWYPRGQPYRASLPAQNPSQLLEEQAQTSPHHALNQHGHVPHTLLVQGSHQVQDHAYQQFPPQYWTNRPPNQTRSRTDVLDSEYYMRTGSEAHDFFKKGRVFSMLWSEAASETRAGLRNEDEMYTEKRFDDAITIGRFGEPVYQQIRRFVIMHVKRREHVYACPITTYSGRATTKRGCNPKEYSIIHMTGTDARTVPGEIRGVGGMTKDAIEVEPANETEYLGKASRLRFGKTIAIEWNVKVKNIGKVVPQDMSKLIAYWKEEHLNGSDDSDDEEPVPTSNPFTTPYSVPANASHSDVHQSLASEIPATTSWNAYQYQTAPAYTNAYSSDMTPRTHPVQNSFLNNLNSNSSAQSTPRDYSLPNMYSGVLPTSQTHYSPSSHPQDNTSHQPHGSR